MREITIAKECEWRFEVDEPEIEIKLLSGTAECFGTELAVGPPYKFRYQKAAIFTWHGCVLQLDGEPLVEYIAEETPMLTYLNLHFALNGLRKQAEFSSATPDSEASLGPRVCIVGPKDAGKTSLLKTLEAYALKQFYHPICVNLSPTQSMLALPGSFSAFHLATMLDIQDADGFGSSMATGPTQIQAKSPLVYSYGLDEALDNPKLYKNCVSRLAITVASRMSQNDDARRSGLLIDTPGMVDSEKGYNILHSILTDFRVNVCLVLGSERLYSAIKRKYNDAHWLKVLKIPKSGGCVDRSSEWIQHWQAACVKQYFYGDYRMPLSPLSIVLDAQEVVVYRVLEASAHLMRSSVLPLGMGGDGEEDGTSAAAVENGDSGDGLGGHFMQDNHLERIHTDSMTILQNSILAVSSVSADEDEHLILDSCILGYVFVSDVDDTKNRLTVLSPVQHRFPNNALLMGTLKWQDS
ncbi:mRNA cleavage and polyadenylation specificity factor complex subunit [Schizosaccharomyces japonicus yFS275]|uniref:Polynucleotide 5'-hydroxyl-kinase GRC3 n=1 Tax=Schizosaccharomyces japonicus (strain yFS275 / FY16936) TaxID=402676 RepID=B6JYX0_SCHJY|nr:mRNA cleavage and polyadenylation specificity factor complex subunit [Schizosaccharomyces japonicus yFS275]EEB06738.1 mRNA cleavage and polyadenylation specificity factor complex subunit [Schizosaccharomyces japonicus yFS275]